MEFLYGDLMVTPSTSRGTQQRDDLPLVAPINAKVAFIHRDDHMFGIQFAHSNHAEIGQVWPAIGVAPRQVLKLSELVRVEFSAGWIAAAGL
jgi:hypothetical protein